MFEGERLRDLGRKMFRFLGPFCIKIRQINTFLNDVLSVNFFFKS
jgi:hypothetical protein